MDLSKIPEKGQIPLFAFYWWRNWGRTIFVVAITL